MDRRDFIKYGASSLFAAPLMAHGLPPLYTDNYASPITSVFDKKASTLTVQPGGTLNSEGILVDKVMSWTMDELRVKHMLDEAVLNLTNKKTIGKAWESLFPTGQPNANTKIGIKLNFSYGDWKNDQLNKWSHMYCPFGPKAAVTNAIVSGLTQMLEGSFPVENIIFIERMYSVGERKYFPVVQGYRPVMENEDGLFIDKPEGAPGQHWIYAASPLELPEGGPSFVAAPDFPDQYKAPQRIYSAYYSCDFLINYAIGKDHRASGITGVMKNNYGCTDNPVGTHGTGEWRTDDSPFAGTRRCVPVFYKNVNLHSPYILNILDALSVVYEGGPLSGMLAHANTLAVSKDPVALDTLLLKIINEERAKRGLTRLKTSDGRTEDGHPNAAFLRYSSEIHELGSMSYENVTSLDLSATSTPEPMANGSNGQSYISNVYRENGNYRVEVFLDDSKNTRVVESRIVDMRGRTVKADAGVRSRSNRVALTWDHRKDTGELAKEGIYIWYINVDGRMHNCTINDFYTI